MTKAIEDLEKKASSDPMSIEHFFTKKHLNWSDQNVVQDFFNPNLNDSQKSAVHFAVGASHVALIHGPPGKHMRKTAFHVNPCAGTNEFSICVDC